MHTALRVRSSLLLILLGSPLLTNSAPQQTSDIDIDISQQSSSGSNPSCADVAFAQISCPAPGLCYYSDRSGTPACCPPGQNCQTGTGTGPSDTSAPSDPAPDSSPDSEDSPPARSDGGNSDSSEGGGSSYNGGGSYVGAGAENVLVLMNNSAHARGLEGGSGVGRFALRMVWWWILMSNAFGL